MVVDNCRAGKVDVNGQSVHRFGDIFYSTNGRNGGWAIRCTDESVIGLGEVFPMVRQAHLEAAKHHLEAASKHLETADKYRDGDPDGAERHSEEAWAASEIAGSKSTAAHGATRRAAAGESLV